MPRATSGFRRNTGSSSGSAVTRWAPDARRFWSRPICLVNGTTVIREEGGHIDSYQLVFDGNEIIFAEGIAVESLLVTADLRARLPRRSGARPPRRPTRVPAKASRWTRPRLATAPTPLPA